MSKEDGRCPDEENRKAYPQPLRIYRSHYEENLKKPQ